MAFRAATTALFVGIAAAANCRNMTFPLWAEGRNGVFNVAVPNNTVELTDFILNAGQQGTNFSDSVLQNYTTISGIWNISASYCEPDSGPSDTLQVLNHGLGFDRLYWDFAFNNYNYSYVNTAVDKYGYSIFSFDQVGTGNSTRPDPLHDVQGGLQVGVLKAITDRLRNGTIPHVKKYKKMVHVGHSLGSIHVYALTARWPNITDGIILTGFAQNSSFVPLLAASTNSGLAHQIAPRFEGYQNCYITEVTPIGQQLTLLGPNAFDPNLVPYLFVNNQPVTCGLRLTITGEARTLNGFQGPVYIVTGERDIPFCGGNCLAPPTGYPNIPAFSQHLIPNASSFAVDIIPGAGHALNVQYAAPTSWQLISNWLSAHNFSSTAGS